MIVALMRAAALFALTRRGGDRVGGIERVSKLMPIGQLLGEGVRTSGGYLIERVAQRLDTLQRAI